MREIKKYKKEKSTPKQIARKKALNKFQYDISKCFYDTRYKKNKN